MPLDVVGQLFPRSSLFRSGVTVVAGVMDSGYRGVIGAMLKVENSRGVLLYRYARAAQMMFYEIGEVGEGYKGQFQGREGM